MSTIDPDYFNVDKPSGKMRIDDILTEGEEVLLRLSPNRRAFLLESIFKGLPIALLWAGIDVGIILLMVYNGVFSQMGFAVFFIIGFFALHLIPVWLYIASVAKRLAGYKNVEYAFTDKRIILSSGVIGVDFKSFYYTDIASVMAKVGLFDKMFKVGDIYLVSASDKAVIEDIPNPYAYSAKIQDLIRDLKADMSFPNDLRPEENHGYNTKYRK